jgi:AcrR family transcriptional regulator
MMSLREQQKSERRHRILDTAERLIRETGGTDFSMRRLVAEAHVSFATPFNLFGSKEGLLYALLARSLDKITIKGLAFQSSDPSLHIIEAAENAVQSFLDDPVFLRPLYQVLLSVSHPVHRPVFMKRTFSYWNTAALTLPNDPECSDPALLDAITHALMAHFIGLLELWVHRDIEDAVFQKRAIWGVILCVQVALKPEQAAAMMNHFKPG